VGTCFVRLVVTSTLATPIPRSAFHYFSIRLPFLGSHFLPGSCSCRRRRDSIRTSTIGAVGFVVAKLLAGKALDLGEVLLTSLLLDQSDHGTMFLLGGSHEYSWGSSFVLGVEGWTPRVVINQSLVQGLGTLTESAVSEDIGHARNDSRVFPSVACMCCSTSFCIPTK
jgi:hypothetical protein